jgi:hypothetical protein
LMKFWRFTTVAFPDLFSCQLSEQIYCLGSLKLSLKNSKFPSKWFQNISPSASLNTEVVLLNPSNINLSSKTSGCASKIYFFTVFLSCCKLPLLIFLNST